MYISYTYRILCIYYIISMYCLCTYYMHTVSILSIYFQCNFQSLYFPYKTCVHLIYLPYLMIYYIVSMYCLCTLPMYFWYIFNLLSVFQYKTHLHFIYFPYLMYIWNKFNVLLVYILLCTFSIIFTRVTTLVWNLKFEWIYHFKEKLSRHTQLTPETKTAEF